LESVQRIRYPPFDHANIDPDSLPITEVIVESNSPPPTPFKIGSESGWLVEWRGLTEDDNNLPRIQSITTTATLPFLMRTRNGWYIEPDPLHAVARKLIAPTVMLLIFSLFLHAIAPALEGIPILSWLTQGTYQIGPLDYPKLLFITFPIFVLPILIRIYANSRDIKRQNTYINTPLKEPNISLNIGDGWVEITDLKLPDNVQYLGARIQSGVAIPERKTMLQSANRTEGKQPPPGMSTALPEKRLTGGEEHGTGVGESTPLAVDYSRILLLEPMRVRARGDMETSNIWPIRLNGPHERWPGTIYSSVIALHWEIHLHATWQGMRLRWVNPVIMPQTEKEICINELPLRAARSEETKD
jgi:hypothetical protein